MAEDEVDPTGRERLWPLSAEGLAAAAFDAQSLTPVAEIAAIVGAILSFAGRSD